MPERKFSGISNIRERKGEHERLGHLGLAVGAGQAIAGGALGGLVRAGGQILRAPMIEELGNAVLDSAVLTGTIAGQLVSGAADWSGVTALCVLLFTLFHFPCATTLWTIRRESGSTRDMLRAAAIPTVIGLFLCWLVGLNGG